MLAGLVKFDEGAGLTNAARRIIRYECNDFSYAEFETVYKILNCSFVSREELESRAAMLDFYGLLDSRKLLVDLAQSQPQDAPQAQQNNDRTSDEIEEENVQTEDGLGDDELADRRKRHRAVGRQTEDSIPAKRQTDLLLETQALASDAKKLAIQHKARRHEILKLISSGEHSDQYYGRFEDFEVLGKAMWAQELYSYAVFVTDVGPRLADLWGERGDAFWSEAHFLKHGRKRQTRPMKQMALNFRGTAAHTIGQLRALTGQEMFTLDQTQARWHHETDERDKWIRRQVDSGCLAPDLSRQSMEEEYEKNCCDLVAMDKYYEDWHEEDWPDGEQYELESSGQELMRRISCNNEDRDTGRLDEAVFCAFVVSDDKRKGFEQVLARLVQELLLLINGAANRLTFLLPFISQEEISAESIATFLPILTDDASPSAADNVATDPPTAAAGATVVENIVAAGGVSELSEKQLKLLCAGAGVMAFRAAKALACDVLLSETQEPIFQVNGKSGLHEADTFAEMGAEMESATADDLEWIVLMSTRQIAKAGTGFLSTTTTTAAVASTVDKASQLASSGDVIVCGTEERTAVVNACARRLGAPYVPFRIAFVEGQMNYGGEMWQITPNPIPMTAVWVSLGDYDNILSYTVVDTATRGKAGMDYSDVNLMDNKFEAVDPSLLAQCDLPISFGKQGYDCEAKTDTWIHPPGRTLVKAVQHEGEEDIWAGDLPVSKCFGLHIAMDLSRYKSNAHVDPEETKFRQQNMFQHVLNLTSGGGYQCGGDGHNNLPSHAVVLPGGADTNPEIHGIPCYSPYFHVDSDGKACFSAAEAERACERAVSIKLVEQVKDAILSTDFVLRQSKSEVSDHFCNETVYGKVNILMVTGMVRLG
jgi:hypothetical protein